MWSNGVPVKILLPISVLLVDELLLKMAVLPPGKVLKYYHPDAAQLIHGFFDIR